MNSQAEDLEGHGDSLFGDHFVPSGLQFHQSDEDDVASGAFIIDLRDARKAEPADDKAALEEITAEEAATEEAADKQPVTASIFAVSGATNNEDASPETDPVLVFPEIGPSEDSPINLFDRPPGYQGSPQDNDSEESDSPSGEGLDSTLFGSRKELSLGEVDQSIFGPAEGEKTEAAIAFVPAEESAARAWWRLPAMVGAGLLIVGLVGFQVANQGGSGEGSELTTVNNPSTTLKDLPSTTITEVAEVEEPIPTTAPVVVTTTEAPETTVAPTTAVVTAAPNTAAPRTTRRPDTTRRPTTAAPTTTTPTSAPSTTVTTTVAPTTAPPPTFGTTSPPPTDPPTTAAQTTEAKTTEAPVVEG